MQVYIFLHCEDKQYSLLGTFYILILTIHYFYIK